MTKTGCRCGATWTGLRIEHCPSCHETFTGTTSGDMHRTGKHHISVGPDRRRCLTVEEMRAKGMKQNQHGYWTSGGVSPWSAKAGTPILGGTGRPRIAEQTEMEPQCPPDVQGAL